MAKLTSLVHILPWLVVLLVIQPCFAQDWPQYRGPSFDGKTNSSLEVTGQLKLHWKAPTPLGFSSFAVGDGKAITLVGRNSREVCVALDEKTGQEIWAVELGRTDYGHDGGNAGAQGNRGGDGPRSTPTIDEGRVYVYDAHLKLWCFSIEQGNQIWSRDIESDFSGRNIKWKNATSPVIVGNHVHVGGGGAGQTFLAFDKSNGELKWKSGDEILTHATPVPATINNKKQLVFYMQSGLVGIDIDDGSEIWRAEYPFDVSSAASPVVYNNFVYCSAGYGVGAGLFQVRDTGNVRQVWRKPNRLINHWSTPVEYNGHLFGLYKFKRYGNSPLQCVNIETGEVIWDKDGFGQGNCILVGDKIVVLSDAGELVVVQADTREYKEIARHRVLTGKCWSTPAFADGKIFIRSTTEGACVSFE